MSERCLVWLVVAWFTFIGWCVACLTILAACQRVAVFP